MKINEIMKASNFVVKKDNEKQTVMQDPKTGTTTIIDKRKNPTAISYDDKTKTAVVKQPGAQEKKGIGGKDTLKPGTKVSFKR